MAKDTGRFDLEDAGWEEPDDTDHYTTFNASREVAIGTIAGLVIGGLLGAGAVALALVTKVNIWWLVAVASVLIGTAAGGISGKLIEIRRALRRRARRAKLDEQEKKRKKKPPREVHDDDYRG